MVALALNQFAGMMPRVARRLLPEKNSQIARNAKLTSGELRPFNTPLDIMAAADPGVMTLYKFDEDAHDETKYWFQWDTDVDVVRSLISGDTQERTYWTDGVQPRMTVAGIATSAAPYPSASYNLGLPAPSAPTFAVTGTATDTNNPEARVYICTFVTAYGEEGPASLPSAVAQWNQGQTATVGNLGPAPTGNYNIQSMRIYRSLSGSQTTGYQFVDEIPVSQNTYTDNKAGTDLGEICPSITWVAPPAGLKGLIALPCGSLVGFVGKDIYFSEPYQMHAWPIAYMQSVEHEIVGLGAYGNTVVVCTEGYPVLLSGSDPASMTPTVVAENYSCVSKRSIVSMESGVMFATAFGLVLIGMYGAKIATEQHYTRDEWLALNPASMHARLYDNRYYAFYQAGNTQGGLIYYPAENDLSYLDVYPTATYVDKQMNALYMAISGRIQKWDYGTSKQTYTWRSREFYLPAPVNFGAGQLDADSYPVTLNVIVDGALKFTTAIQNANSFRLPAGFMSKSWSFELVGSANVQQLQIAESISGLGAV